MSLATYYSNDHTVGYYIVTFMCFMCVPLKDARNSTQSVCSWSSSPLNSCSDGSLVKVDYGDYITVNGKPLKSTDNGSHTTQN